MTSKAIRYETGPHTSASVGFQARDEFDAAWKDGWRQVRRTLRGLGRRERQVIDDLTRGRGVSMLREGFEIVRACSTCPADRVALTEQLRGFLLVGTSLELTEAEAMLRETEANEAGNTMQIKHAFYRSRGTRDGVIEAMTRQSVMSQTLADTLHRDRPALVSVG